MIRALCSYPNPKYKKDDPCLYSFYALSMEMREILEFGGEQISLTI
jgi:hypothetical protein